MNRRDEFAAHTLPALMAAYPNWLPHQLASRAYEIADAMIAASPPSEIALQAASESVAASIEANILGEWLLAGAWRGLDNEARTRLTGAFAHATQRELRRFFAPENPAR